MALATLGRHNSGYDRIQGAVHNLGYTISDQTVGNILRRHGIVPAPERRKQTTWKEFIRAHQEVFADSDEVGHLFRSMSDSVPMISDSYRSEATLRVCDKGVSGWSQGFHA